MSPEATPATLHQSLAGPGAAPQGSHSLDDRYTRQQGHVFLSGVQALVRLPLMQRQRDAAAGLNTAGFISGYRGSPLGGYDQALWRAAKHLERHRIKFTPGINEDLAATAVLGTQQVGLDANAEYDGVFAMWYGKGPGLDRSGDALKHGNAFGSAPRGGVLVVAGDDHGAVSSSMPHQSEQAMISWMMPVLNPASVQEYLDFGLLGFALSRYSGCWVGFKAISETVESGAVVSVDPHRPRIAMPEDRGVEGLHLRWPEPFKGLETRLVDRKLTAALAFARANAIDRVELNGGRRRLGIVTTGKAYSDVRQALQDLGLDDGQAEELGIGLYKVGMSWPLEPHGARDFAEGYETLLVVEEKAPLIEDQLKTLFYDLPDGRRPRVLGKSDESGAALLPATGELDPAMVARALTGRLAGTEITPAMAARLALIDAKQALLSGPVAGPQRTPYFCAGCPHNRSTKVPDGSQAMAGIGCHFMAVGMNRNTATVTQMGGEGANWVGRAPFTGNGHVFQNLGDGTYCHSGLMAMRQAIAAGVNITYKILYNDAVAMTGGQPVEGQLTVPEITRQVRAEGVSRIAVVADDPGKYPARDGFADHVTLHHRDELDAVQRELRDIPGCTVLIYDQTCAAEKRRRRKRGTVPDPARRVFINDLVCEGCGDCSVQSNCVAVVPLETEFGTKRRIDQSSCNKDYSCLDGFCPAMVTVEGGTPRRGISNVPAEREAALLDALPKPDVPALERPYNMVVTGIGGTGVVTIGALVTMAAHLEGRGASVLDFTGFAQKGGAVVSHVRLASSPADLHAVRIAAASADLLLGCDLVVAVSPETLGTLCSDRTRAVVNSHETPTVQAVLERDAKFDGRHLRTTIDEAVSETDFLDASRIAAALFGDSIAANLFLLGYAWQKGLVPVGLAALEQAIELNGVAVAENKRVLAWGRMAAHDGAAVGGLAGIKPQDHPRQQTLDEIVIERSWFLADYQDQDYARRYERLVRRVAEVECAAMGRGGALAEAVARCHFKLLAYKDEYEVARLYSNGGFKEKLERQFTGDLKLSYHMAPPLLTRNNLHTGLPCKRTFRGFMPSLFKLLAKGKALRGTAFDPFGYQAERREERRLIAEFEKTVETLLAGLSPEKHGVAVRIASLPGGIRGFGPIKQKALGEFRRKHAALMADYQTPATSTPTVAAVDAAE